MRVRQRDRLTAPIVIVGGGISGLAAAIALGRAGNAVEVHEQADAPAEFGAGIQLGPNAVRALRDLAADGDLDAVAVRPGRLAVRDGGSGRAIAATPLGSVVERRHGAPYLTIARADLHAILLDRAAAAGIPVHFSHRVESVRRAGGGFALGLGDGERLDAAVLLGADGLWSQTRAMLRPSTRPRFTGQTAWRTTLTAAQVPRDIAMSDVTLWMARGCHAVHYPVSAGERLNLAIFTEGSSQAQGWDTPGDKADLLDRLAKRRGAALSSSLLALVEAADDFVKWPLFELSPAIAWGMGPATLVGDAAHPMLPYLAQGAAMGLEDAVVLGTVLTSPSQAERAFRVFERQRTRRVARVQRAARANARIFHMAGPPAFARDLVLGLGERLLPGALFRRYDWLYGGGPT